MSATAIATRPYGAFSRGVRQRTGARRVPLGGSLELTARCNLGCTHCFVNQPAGDQQSQRRELSLTELHRILDQVVAEGCFWLLLTGGEPLLRPDFSEIYRDAKRRGLLITLFTNATALTPAIADLLADWPPFSIEVSLYGATRETYERITRTAGSHERCLRGIELLRERGLPLVIKTMVLRQNVHELDELRAFADQRGLEFRFDPVINPRLDGDPRPLDSRLSAEEIVDLDLKEPSRLAALVALRSRAGEAPRDPQRLYHCGAGTAAFHIDAEGRLSPCLLSRNPSFDLRRGTFHEGWHDFLPQVVDRHRSIPDPCGGCSLHAICGQCPAAASLESGNEETRVDHLCRLAHLRAERVAAATGGTSRGD